MPKGAHAGLLSGLPVRSSPTRSVVAPGRVTISGDGTSDSARRSAQTAQNRGAVVSHTVCGVGFSVPSYQKAPASEQTDRACFSRS